jgi:hypothetical protein
MRAELCSPLPAVFPYALCLLQSNRGIIVGENPKGGDQMDLWRKIGVTIIFGIVAIIGGGLFWVLSEDWAVVFTYLSIVGFFLLAFLFNPEQIVNEIVFEEESGEH